MSKADIFWLSGYIAGAVNMLIMAWVYEVSIPTLARMACFVVFGLVVNVVLLRITRRTA
jgi:hypothetical protein